MKLFLSAAAVLTGALSFALLVKADPPPHVVPPPPDNPGAYQPLPMPKPLPMEPPPAPQQGIVTHPSIQNEDAFVQAYIAHRSPRIMVFVNRTINGEKLPKEKLEELIRIEEKQSASGAVNVNANKSAVATGQSNSAGYGGSSSTVINSNSNSSSSFSSQGPADYTKTTSIKVAPDKPDKFDAIGASAEDYELIEDSLVKYFDNSGKVQIRDSDAARAKLDREKILRLENGDGDATRLLSTELQQDILIHIQAQPTHHADYGNAVRILAKSVSTTDGRILGTAFVDMPLPITKVNVNVFTRYIAQELMGEMTKKWAGNPEFDPVEVRIYKTAGVDDALKIRKWLQATRGVQSVITRGSTGAEKTSYAAFAVGYAGAPEDLYADLQDALGASQGLKAVDVQANTINLEVTGELKLVTTTRKVETKTTTTTTEEKKIESINPAPPQP